MWGWQMGMGWSWWMIFVGILGIIFWAGIIFLIVWGIRRLTNRENHHYEHQVSNALDILKERYARGELTKDQYEQMKKDLS